MTAYTARFQAFLVALVLCSSSVAYGGGGERMLLVVNPNDENSLRIANAYQQARAIPDNNIVFIAPPPSYGYGSIDLSQADFLSYYVTPISQALAQRGLTNQVDYIGTLGQPNRYYVTPTNVGDYANSLTYGLSLLTPFSQGLDPDNATAIYQKLYQDPGTIPIGANPAIHHTQTYQVQYWANKIGTKEATPRATNYYMGGEIGHTGVQGNTPDQIIWNLQRNAAADGTRPVGTVYFEENDDVRSNAREYQWPQAQAQLTARGVPWKQERLVSGAAPLNRTDVRGATTGLYWLNLPNGSKYLPGSWADNLTSYGGHWENTDQTKISQFIAAGAAATCGSVVEPYLAWTRFAQSSIHTFIADGSTLGEAFFKSVATPDVQLFLGDLLAQPYADVPVTSITSGPAQRAVVSGTISLGAQGSLVAPKIATGVRRLDLFVDGKLKNSLTGSAGSFTIDTTGLSDGVHELRVVAVNNAQAESEGYILRNVIVNNHNRSVAAGDGDVQIQPKQVMPIAVSAAQGDGAVSRIELRSLGRTVGQINSAAGDIPLDATKLAYGDNRVVPVAVFADGSEVAGEAINVERAKPWKAGRTPTPTALRQPGFKGEFFLGQAGSNLATSTFGGTADTTKIFSKLVVNSGKGASYTELRHPGLLNPALSVPAMDLNKLSVRYSAAFEIKPGNEGEYEFFFFDTCDSVQLSIDGEGLQAYDNAGIYTPLSGSDVFLLPGEHNLQVLAANTDHTDWFDVALLYRGPDGITKVADSTFFYQTPEPSSLVLLGCASLCALRRRRGSRQRPGCSARPRTPASPLAVSQLSRA